jgi:hypothetical protein
MRGYCLALCLCSTSVACVGTTGSDLVEFNVYVAGPQGAQSNEALSFTTRRNWEVSLTRARLHIGAMYLNRALPVAGAQTTSCTLPGLYVASVPGGLVPEDGETTSYVNVLSGTPQQFSVQGQGTADRALSAAIWLTGGDINAEQDDTVILDVAGTARMQAQAIPFEGRVTISQNRAVPAPNPALPGAKPICRQRIVSPIAVDITPASGGSLLLRIDPAGWFANVDFAALGHSSSNPSMYVFADDNSNQPSLNLYETGLLAIEGVYTFAWVSKLAL